MNATLNGPIGASALSEQSSALYHIYTDREKFQTLEYPHEDIKAWLLTAVDNQLTYFGTSKELNDKFIENYTLLLDSCKKVNQTENFDFYKLIFGSDDHDHHSSMQSWAFQLQW